MPGDDIVFLEPDLVNVLLRDVAGYHAIFESLHTRMQGHQGGTIAQCSCFTFRWTGAGRSCSRLKESYPRPTETKTTATASRLYLMSSKIIGQYRIDLNNCIGQGNFSAVYLGSSAKTGCLVAVKQIKKDLNQNLTQINTDLESKIMKSVQHPNVVRLIECVQSQSHTYLIMEHCNEGSLDVYIRKRCSSRPYSLAETEALQIFKQVIEGYKALHEKKIVHRDLKPANILIHNGVAKISDFGLGKILEQSREGGLMKSYAGTPLFMSPQILENKLYSEKTDVWSLGVLLYSVLCGQTPWPSQNEKQLYESIMSKPLQFPKKPAISQQTKDLICYMLKIDEKNRLSWENIFAHPYFTPPQQNRMYFERLNGLKTLDQAKEAMVLGFKNLTVNNQSEAREQARRAEQISDILRCNQKIESPQEGQIQNIQNNHVAPPRQYSDYSIPTSIGPDLSIKSETHHQQQQQARYEAGISPNNQRSSRREGIFQTRSRSRERSLTPRSLNTYVQVQLEEIRNKRTVERVKVWVYYRQNKATFFYHLVQQLFDVNEKQPLVVDEQRQDFFRFLCCKYQLQIHQKIATALRNKKLEKSTKFTEEEWAIFCTSKEWRESLKLFEADINLVLPYLIQLIVKSSQKYPSAQADRLFQDILDMHTVQPIPQSAVRKAFDQLLQLFTASVMENLKIQGQSASRELVKLAVNLQTCLVRSQVMKYSFPPKFDFQKHYDRLKNESIPELLEELTK